MLDFPHRAPVCPAAIAFDGTITMAIHVALNHKTHYKYDRPIHLGPQVVRLRPAPHSRTPILAYSLKIEPKTHFINWQQDPQSNYLARLVFPEPTTEFKVEVDLVAEMAIFNPFDFFLEPHAENCPFTYEASLARELRPYLETQPAGPELTKWVASVDHTPVRTIDFLVALNQRLQHEIGYVIRLEPGIQTCEETLTIRKGSCRDTAWLLVQIARHLGLAARFVSGYLIQLTPDVKSLDGPSGAEHDFTDLHAWTEVYLPGAGWVGLDPTSGLFAGEGHIPLAATPDASSAAPISGVIDECETTFHHEMTVTRVLETPRVTKPYSEAQWNDILALGHQVDRELAAGDVRLTMGGEPTFVSIDDSNSPEWSVAAHGPTKRRLAEDLFNRMRHRFAPGSLIHFGQGKWYPGEPLPRWALSCYWRKDGVAIWENHALIGNEAVDYGYNAHDASRFMEALCARLLVESEFLMPAYEDVFYYLWKERHLPANVDVFNSNLEDPIERVRLARLFEQGLGKTIGFVLPLRRMGRHWTSQPWFTRTERIFLIPGDSPLGYRLPLDALPWTKPEDAEYTYDPDPFSPRDALPPRPERHPERFGLPSSRRAPQRTAKAKPPATGASSPWIARPAICVESRGGRLYVFMPPVEFLADYLDLIAAIEDTAAYLKMPVLIEGYQPAYDPRVSVMKVTPDPGVIEVNIQPAASWDEMVANTTALYDLARESRLGTEKFLLDGRHTGTGGGNHVVIGAATPEDSPFLRRPDLLRSLVGYWQNHPSLSYLFSGLFIGPTSQHPRLDEARTDSLYELEIAFDQVPHKGEPNIQPWMVDRVFRYILADLTGNTHRTEICIDKLYPWDSASSRLGLVELRAFEMPPHARMSLAQQLLVRTLISWFWREPYRQKVTLWGTALHDRFLLPHFVELDWQDVLHELREAGYAVKSEWFAPHVEFRFPLIGSIHARGITLELRHALEPWLVLGEEVTAGGTARNVDSSLERLQVKITGATGDRYVVLCNGRPVPVPVGGVRYRAWQPPSCLHPTIGVHTPLVFDIVDTWSRRSIAGCTYHVSHPGGRAQEQFPVNAYEAESRRLARFSAIGHTPGPMVVPPAEMNPEFPFTLDLRRATPE
jgi:uncharacterized protein (DUF2126 family)/transglutaminase-like putative cysteine protease